MCWTRIRSELSQTAKKTDWSRSEEHTSELQSPCNLVCRLLLEKKKMQEVQRHAEPVQLCKLAYLLRAGDRDPHQPHSDVFHDRSLRQIRRDCGCHAPSRPLWLR